MDVLNIFFIIFKNFYDLNILKILIIFFIVVLIFYDIYFIIYY